MSSSEHKDWDDWNDRDADGNEAFKPLTSQEAADLRSRLPALSPWSVVAWQAAVGVVMVALWGLGSLQGGKTVSALVGAVAVVVPNALMAWGMTRRSVVDAGTAVTSFMAWELMKNILAGAILVAIVLGYPALSWPALLTTLVVCLKANWLALLRRGRIRK